MIPLVIIPTLDAVRARKTVQVVLERAGTSCEVLVVEDGERRGYTRTVNVGLAQAQDPDTGTWRDVCILVDDCVPSENWLATLQEEAKRRASLRVWFAGPSGTCRTFPQAAGRLGDRRRPQVVAHLAGFCLWIEAEALACLGLLDERYTHYGSDVDYQRRAARDYGATSLWVPSVYVAHELHPPHAEWWAEDQRTLETQWSNVHQEA